MNTWFKKSQLESILGIETLTLANFFGVFKPGANESGAVKIHILCQGEKASLQNKDKTQRKNEIRDRRKGALSILNFPFFLWGLLPPVCFLSLVNLHFWIKLHLCCFCRLKSKVSWWYSRHVTLLFGWLFTHGSQVCDSRARQTQVERAVLLHISCVNLGKVL